MWFTLGQRTLHFETYVMPAPEENHERFYEHLLRRNLQAVRSGVRHRRGGRGVPRRPVAGRARSTTTSSIASSARSTPTSSSSSGRPCASGTPAASRTDGRRSTFSLSFMLSHATVPAGTGAVPLRSGKYGASPLPSRSAEPGRAAMPNVPTMAKLVVVGGGRMGEALLAGLVDAGWAPVGELAVVEVLPTGRPSSVSAFPGSPSSASPERPTAP